MQQEDAHDNRKEAAQCADDIVGAHVFPFFEQYGRAGKHWGGEEDVIDGRHQGCVKDIQCFVQVVDLCANTSYQAQQQQPGQRVSKHWLPGDGLLNGDAQSLHAGDGQSTNHRADGDVDQDVGLPVAWGQYKDEDECYDDDSCREDHEAWRQMEEKMRIRISYIKQSKYFQKKHIFSIDINMYKNVQKFGIKETNTYILQGCIKLIRSDKDFYTVTKY